MSEPKRYVVRWSDGHYTVNVPEWDGGEVVAAEDYDRLRDELRVVRDRLMGEDAVEAAGNGYHDSGNADTDEWAAFHAALAAAWASIEGDKT